MIGVVAYHAFVYAETAAAATVIDFLCKARIPNFQINSISVRRAVEHNCQTRASSDLTTEPSLKIKKSFVRRNISCGTQKRSRAM